ncbi:MULTISPECIES: transmembrane repetitive protein [unclassified Xanthomonas]|uniref:transmembrane repetitive protein n=1 Tax=unclassified Xanthomonas TaxID=2643310 RepID=UPI002A7EBB65|nr:MULTISPECIES: transmembrane repetitive protein [unclassified Xanthomonas]MDY4296867.1 transmembrane repetitive protein [Xanthomonas sp. LF02-5]MDY4358374.1 transmembrane repetitive protein [Xanthomonas sp. LF04-12]
MTRAADILNVLLARTPRKLLRDRRTGLPYAWAHWIAAQPALPRPFAAPELIAAMPPAQPPATLRLPALPLWQAFRRLWWQHWDPAPYDQRWWRRIAVLLSLLLHLLFAIFLLWVAFVRWLPPLTDADQAGRVQVEFVGRGTPAESGGGAPAEAAASTEATSPTPPRAQRAASARPRPTPPAAAAPAQPAEPTPAAPAPTPTTPTTASAPPPPAEQPLQVTETPTPTRDFVLPPPPSVRVAVPTPRAVVPPDVQVPVREVEVVTDVPTVAQLRSRDIAVPRPVAPQVQVREREVPAPLPQVQVPAPQLRTPTPTPVLPSADVPQVRQIEVPTPSTATASAPTPAPPAAPAASPDTTPASAQTPQPAPAGAAASATAKPTAPAAGTAPPGSQAASPGSGPAPVARDGGWATPQRGDDWGAAARNRPGDAGAGASKGGGLFNADGSVRLADGRGNDQAPARSAPGSETDTWTRERIEKAGEWLKRPPYDYTPTSFDKYWLPNATLLEEWVRRGIKSVKIPIPGTTSSISCVVSILQVGGGCSITDPNLNEQPAGARPPPNVPFKRELQEDNGSR